MKGHIEKRRGRYWAVVEFDRITDPETGERPRRRHGIGSYRTKGEAESAIENAKDMARRGWQGPSNTTVADYLRIWLPGLAMDHSPTTVALYNTIAENYLIPFIGGIRLEDLTSADLTKLYIELLDHGGRPHPDGSPRGLAAKTVRSAHTTIRRALQDAVEEQPPRIPWNPAVAAKSPKVNKTRDPAHWTAPQLRTFLEDIRNDRLAAMWITAANTGLRRGELVGLRWQDIDLDREQLTIRQTRVAYGNETWTKEPKTSRSRRTIPIPSIVLAALRRHAEIQDIEKSFAATAYLEQGYVFADEIGDPLRPTWVSSTFVRRVKHASLPRISLHGLRHSFATVALEAGVDVLYVSELLGHSTPTGHHERLPARPPRAARRCREHHLGGDPRLSGRTTGGQRPNERPRGTGAFLYLCR